MELFNPSIEQLVREIVAVNHAWKEAEELFEDPNSPLAKSLRDLKTRLQVRLLRNYAPERVYLVKDTEAENKEPLYGLRLAEPIGSWRDAAHMPVRVAQENLSTEEIEYYMRFDFKFDTDSIPNQQERHFIAVL